MECVRDQIILRVADPDERREYIPALVDHVAKKVADIVLDDGHGGRTS